jgi:uncharacterized membrane protein YdjX (TVP38/TMEM64 family)
LLAGLLALVLLPLFLFQEQIAAISVEALRRADDQPILVAVTIVAALMLDILLPVPNGVTNTLAGAVFGLGVGTVVIWTGMMGASMAGYGVGALAARPLASRLVGADDLAAAHRVAEQYGVVALILTRLVPVAAEIATIGAGISRMPLRLFLIVMSLSNLGVAITYAAIGSSAIAAQSPTLMLVGAVGLPLAGFAFYRLIEHRQQETK